MLMLRRCFASGGAHKPWSPPTMSSNPDLETYPHATGPALETVNKHQHESDLTLWGSWFCPFVQRVHTPTFCNDRPLTLQQVWIALEEKGDIEYTYREARELDVLENKSITNTRRSIPIKKNQISYA